MSASHSNRELCAAAPEVRARSGTVLNRAKITFAAAGAEQTLVHDKVADGYFSVLGETEIRLKYGLRRNRRPLAALREECRARYGEAVREFSPAEKELLSSVVDGLQPVLEREYPLVAELPWRFVKLDSSVEGGLPHTMGRSIVFSERWLDEFLAQGETDEECPAESRVDFWLLHERMHVVQRCCPDPFRRLYEDVWRFEFAAELDRGEWLAQRQLTNPDSGPGHWLYAIPQHDREAWIWPTVILDPESASKQRRPSLEDSMRMIAAHVFFESGRPTVRLGPGGRPQQVEQSAFDALQARFPSVSGLLEPAEIAAEAFAVIVVGDLLGDDHAFTWKTRNVHWKMAMLKRWFWENLRGPAGF